MLNLRLEHSCKNCNIPYQKKDSLCCKEPFPMLLASVLLYFTRHSERS